MTVTKIVVYVPIKGNRSGNINTIKTTSDLGNGLIDRTIVDVRVRIVGVCGRAGFFMRP